MRDLPQSPHLTGVLVITLLSSQVDAAVYLLINPLVSLRKPRQKMEVVADRCGGYGPLYY